MKFLLLLPLLSCGLFKLKPTHPDVKRYRIAGSWVNERQGSLSINCSGAFHLNDPQDIHLSDRMKSVESDIKKISGSRLEVHGFLLNVFEDFEAPQWSEKNHKFRMHLNEAEWFTEELSECS